MRKSVGHYALGLITTVLLLNAFAFSIPIQNLFAANGTNGQQLEATICYASSMRVEGSNQNDTFASFTASTNPYGCGIYKTTDWWWKGDITLTVTFPSGDRTQSGINIPVSNPVAGNDTIAITFPTERYDEFLGRAKNWVDASVPYDQSATRDNYRTDCSGFVSYAWTLAESAVTGTLNQYSNQVSFDDMQPGDALNNQTTGNSGHVVLFVKWVDKTNGTFIAYEENGGPGKAVQTTLTLVRTSSTLGYINEYSFIPKTWVAQRKN
jgi:cell wall-associated NlpC family hydrolase